MIKSFLPSKSMPLTIEQLKCLERLIKDLSSSQIAWISGYFWGIIHDDNSQNNDNFVSQDKILNYDDIVITILYASQTGNAQRVAEQLYNDLLAQQFKVKNINIREYKYKKIAQETFLLIVTSTHGEGEPPEDAVAFYRFLFSKKAPLMTKTYFSVFALGDRSYEHFAKVGKDFDKRLEELGAKRLYNRCDADIDYHQQANSWRSTIVSLLHKKLRQQDKCLNLTQTGNDITKNNCNAFSKEQPLAAYLISKQKITSRSSIKDIHHLEIDLVNSGLQYQPGDALGIWYENDSALVNEILSLLNLTGKEIINFKAQCLSLDIILQKYCELTQNTSFFVRNYANILNDKSFLSLIAQEEKLKKIVTSMPIVDLIRRFPIKLNAIQVLDLFRPLTPRFYSIASSQAEVGNEVHITVSVVRYKVNGYLRSGGASSYLVDRLNEDDVLKIFVECKDNFRLPKDSNTSIIMLASGTGIAPFRAFMQQRFMDGSLGKNWLFFGNPQFINDFLYQVEWQRYFKDGLLTRIDTAWSRDQSNKIYVQNKLLEQGSEIWRWLNDGAHIYVCGDARYMAYSVEQALLKIIMKYGVMNLEKSNEFLDMMRIQKRYQRDVY
ncbi:NADPH-dependent assimilatory sulfite reductase flavoprotein subunit [Blochmannia endosymbiont of Camponotus (Colobopsis) obliquus]|uniref:NADPH-dependent assimilatory sulfite reductase flavoprotein subunit n=1 Tax=Blochmannia endosymbiont of Camponotus (Colobopsis) obliquus TaxID=1505597 RepID=UPI00061A6E21|nr:NADPH-dependent assimilatory sulfite reductase flavoprotein subunit [Blochmannia endosymbiont of Camponotus (Colobopsis) obliquus]AKC60333.1 sulfite reductase [NADPH] flavoprotein alpha-component [Blochmannia endosymbiont of Camponotus (Colobopsis) obliquus]